MKLNIDNPVFKCVCDLASRENFQAFVIGGYVRDLLLKRVSKDIDIVVLGNGIEAAEKTAKKLKNTSKVSVFKRFGTAMFKYKGLEIEFVGARKESYSPDSRKPAVENGSLSDDQNRRDFTINALALSLNKENFGELIDPFQGTEDIGDGIIRTPLEPGITFSDDPLRMMRALRFAAQLNFKIEEKTEQAIRENRERIKIVSEERITAEINKIILSDKPSVGFKLADKTGLLEYIFPELAEMKGVETIKGKSHKDNFLHSLQVLDNIAPVTDNIWLRYAALLHDIAKPRTKRFSDSGWTFHSHEFVGAKMVPVIFKRMRLPLNGKMRYVQKLVRLHLRPIALVKDIVTDSAVRRLLFDAGNDIEDLMNLCEADITSKNEKRVNRYLKNFKIVRQKLREVEEKDRLRNWQPPVSGNEIMEMFDIPPSKTVGILKDSVKEAILEGKIRNERKAAIEYLTKQAKKEGYEPV